MTRWLTVVTWLARLPDSVQRWQWSAQSRWRWKLHGRSMLVFPWTHFYICWMCNAVRTHATSQLNFLQPPYLTITLHKTSCCHHPVSHLPPPHPPISAKFSQPPQITITLHKSVCCRHPAISVKTLFLHPLLLTHPCSENSFVQGVHCNWCGFNVGKSGYWWRLPNVCLPDPLVCQWSVYQRLNTGMCRPWYWSPEVYWVSFVPSRWTVQG